MRRYIAGSAAAGLVWSVALLWSGARLLPAPDMPPLEALALWGLLPGLVLLVQIGVLGQRRFKKDAIIEGGAPATGSPAEIDVRALRNTVEQLLLAVLVWPALALHLPAERLGVVPALACGFVVARLLFWAGYHRSWRARAFGFAASFYPTVLAAAWALWLWGTA